jgi:hypothetical protein
VNIGIVNIGVRSPCGNDDDVKMEILVRLSDTDLYRFDVGIGNGVVRSDYRIGSVVYGINVENCLQIVAGGVWFVMDYKGLDDIANGGIYQSRSCGRNGDFVGMIDLTIRKDDEYREVMIL